ncbi:hypothetical protein V1477_010879 [Vespula maculifrons]|uniref:Uncharacterized protein n=1 Tax=Vespula maculifrons TaxID=7453 RepID=A0ABD2C399_VESMC
MDLQGSFPSSKGKEEKREKRTLTQQARDVGTGPPLPLEYQWDPHMRPWLGPFWPLPWYIRAGSGKQKHRTARSFVERASREHRESIVTTLDTSWRTTRGTEFNRTTTWIIGSQ